MNKLLELERRLKEVEEKLNKLFQLAIIKEIKEDGTAVCILADDESETAPLPWMVRHAGETIEWWAPEPGEQVLILNLSGFINLSLIVPAFYSKDHPAPETDPNIRTLICSDGTSISHNMAESTINIETPCAVTVNAEGDATIAAANVTVTSDGDATVEAGGNVNVDGSMINLNQGEAGGVVCQSHACSFTGSPHPQASTTVMGGA
ncbi:MAG: phage baseplate assembly protein V [Oceanospirillaceae bacterium]|nr:phage baseplate assembly protein V [Oceanospirillaceae bacterium]